MTSWQDDKSRVDPYDAQVGVILRDNAHLFVECVVADPEADKKRNTDFVVRATGGEVACRIRDIAYWEQYGDVTIRNSRPSGVLTEADKIDAGFGRWMLYAWAALDCKGPIEAWVLIDLDIVRREHLVSQARAEMWTRANKDGSSDFLCWGLAWLDSYHAIVVFGGLAEPRLHTTRMQRGYFRLTPKPEAPPDPQLPLF